MLYLLTPTGGRQDALRLCAGYLNAQSFSEPMTWVIVDDCDPASAIPAMREGITVSVVRPPWRWASGQNTQAACLAAGLELIPAGAPLLVIEDDDAYLPLHIELVADALQEFELVGEAPSIYYNVATRRWRDMRNTAHASLCATGMRGGATELFRFLCQRGATRLDMKLWRDYPGAKHLLPQSQVVGIKGMPGRGGIGVGHHAELGEPDPHGDMLRQLLGAERAAEYRWFARAAAA